MSSSTTELRGPVANRRVPSASRGWPAVCSQCMRPVDLETLLPAIRLGRRVLHDCGKVLSRGAA
jgi:hypothetical protein